MPADIAAVFVGYLECAAALTMKNFPAAAIYSSFDHFQVVDDRHAPNTNGVQPSSLTGVRPESMDGWIHESIRYRV